MIVPKRSYLLLCVSAITLFLSINCRYINKLRDKGSSVKNAEGGEQEKQEQKESSVDSIAANDDESTEEYIDVSDDGLGETIDSDGGDDSPATDAINVSYPPTKTVRNLSIMDLQVQYKGLFINTRNHLHIDSEINSPHHLQDDDVKIESDEKRATANNKRTRNSLPGDGDQCCATEKCFYYPKHLSNENGKFSVVHLRDASQFISVAQCVSEYGLCNGDNGKCRLVKETRPVLVWKYPVNLDMNVTYLELNQFVQFEWFEFASHCSCSNNHY